MDLIILIVLIGLAVAIIPCGIAWWLTKRFPTWLRLLITTLPAALIFTPADVSGEGGAGIVPMLFVLIDFLIHGFGKPDPTSSHPGIYEVTSTSIVWGILYAVSMGIVGIRRFFKKNT